MASNKVVTLWTRVAEMLLRFEYLVLASRWPSPVDRLSMLVFLAAIIVLPLIGYWLTILDIRAYMRALRGTLVRIATGRSDVPDWLRDETPPCLRALGLSLPCTEEDVKQAYRRLAKELHPDRGGDVRRFLLLQTHLEQAYYFLRK
jgi:hypothetical protein